MRPSERAAHSSGVVSASSRCARRSDRSSDRTQRSVRADRVDRSSDRTDRTNRSRRTPRTRRAYVISLAIVILGFLPITWMAVASAINGHTLAQEADSVAESQSTWPSEKQRRVLEQAEQYNAALFASRQPVIGGVTREGDDGSSMDFTGGGDEAYVSALAEPDGIMGTVEIPSIDVKLAIRHGSGDDALANGAGHLYGTSLPVGGASTRTVVTAHRGVPGKLLFTKLDKLQPGDVFYFHVNGNTLAYKVFETKTVQPEDIDAVKIVEGKDWATLLTCTPYGVNTERLIVTGERVDMPQSAPYPQDAPKDRTPWLFAAGVLVVVIISALAFAPGRKRRRSVPGRHQRQDVREAREAHRD